MESNLSNTVFNLYELKQDTVKKMLLILLNYAILSNEYEMFQLFYLNLVLFFVIRIMHIILTCQLKEL